MPIISPHHVQAKRARFFPHVRITAILLPTLLLICYRNTAAGDLVPRRIKSSLAAPLLKTAPRIDGKIEASEWSGAQPLKEFAYNKGVRFQTQGWVCRDADNFYFAARCLDDNPDALVTENEGNAIWRNDCIELFVVPDKKGLFFAHLILSCDGKTHATTWVPDEWGEPTRGQDINLRYAVGRETGAWSMELAVPIRAFGSRLTPQSVWALGFNREKHSPPQEVSSFQGGFNKPAQYSDWFFDNRSIVMAGFGVRNIGTRSKKIRAVLKADGNPGQGRELTITLTPGATRELPWRKVAAGLEAGDKFIIKILDLTGRKLLSETYKLVPQSRKTGPVDLKKIPHAKFVKSVLDDPGFFPIAVWAQPAGPAERFKRMGINLFVGGIGAYPRPKGKAWLDAIHKHGHYAIIPFKQKYADQGLNRHPAFIGWMFGDEPDNMNPATGKVKHTPEELLADFAHIRTIDPEHPVFLNLGCGVAHERFLGRGATDVQYAQYPAACDILCFDVYPCNSISPNGHNRLHLVAKGIDRLRKWGDQKKPVWAWIEVNHFSRKPTEGRAPTPDEVKTEIWMALIHGAGGYGFFCHSWSKKFLREELKSKRSFACTAIAPAMEDKLAGINREVRELAPVLNSPSRKNHASVKASGSRIDILVKQHKGATYIFAVNMYRKPASAVISLTKAVDSKVQVLYEDRGLTVVNGEFKDDFAPYAVHLYKIK